jgi:hypothetical protein
LAIALLKLCRSEWNESSKTLRPSFPLRFRDISFFIPAFAMIRLNAIKTGFTASWGRQQGSIGILPVARAAWLRGYRLEAYATLSVSRVRWGRRVPLPCMSLKITDSPLAFWGRYYPDFHRGTGVEFEADDIRIDLPTREPTPEPVSVGLETAVRSTPFYRLFLNQRINRNPMAHIRLELLQRPSGRRILCRKRIRFSEIPCFN